MFNFSIWSVPQVKVGPKAQSILQHPCPLLPCFLHSPNLLNICTCGHIPILNLRGQTSSLPPAMLTWVVTSLLARNRSLYSHLPFPCCSKRFGHWGITFADLQTTCRQSIYLSQLLEPAFYPPLHPNLTHHIMHTYHAHLRPQPVKPSSIACNLPSLLVPDHR